MKLKKLKLHDISNAELSEKEMCRILGGGEKGCCQCGCHYAGKGGGSSSGDNDKANDAHGYVSDLGAQPCCSDKSDHYDRSPYTFGPITL